MTALKDAAFERSNGNQTSRMGLKVTAGKWSNIIVAWLLSPRQRVRVLLLTWNDPLDPIACAKLTVMEEFVMLSCQYHREHVERVQPATCEGMVNSAQNLGRNALANHIRALVPFCRPALSQRRGYVGVKVGALVPM